jgi:glycolate oxidase
MIDSSTVQELSEIVGPEYVSQQADDLAANAADALKQPHMPDVVVRPRSAAEISAIMKLANRKMIPVTPRGAGVGYTGGCVPLHGGIVLNMGRMSQIITIDQSNMYAIVEPCVITKTLMDAADALGLFYPPDPASMKECTLGGNVAENAGGPRCVKYGTTKQYVLGIEFVTPTGDIVVSGGATTKNVAGLDLHSLMIGSEGLLGIMTRIWLRLIPKPAATRTLRACFPSVRKAAECVAAFAAELMTPCALELIDQLSLNAVEDARNFGLPREAKAMLIIEVDGSLPEVERQAAVVERLCLQYQGYDLIAARNDDDAEQLWEVRRAISRSLMKYGNKKINEDIVVPRSRIPDLFDRLTEIAKGCGLLVPAFGHAGDGNIHVNVMLDQNDPDQVERAHKAVGQIMSAAVELGGTITGEHGIGYTKAQYMPLAFSPQTIETMQRVKRALDPNGVLNPGKMFPLSIRAKDC